MQTLQGFKHFYGINEATMLSTVTLHSHFHMLQYSKCINHTSSEPYTVLCTVQDMCNNHVSNGEQNVLNGRDT